MVRQYKTSYLIMFAMLVVGWMFCDRLMAQETYELREKGFTKVSTPPRGSIEGRLQTVRQLIGAGESRKAIKEVNIWLKAHPGHPLIVDAYLLRAEALVARKHYFKALFDYEFILRTYPESEHFHIALEREFKIAQTFANGTNRLLLGMRILPAEGEAEELFIRIQERAPGSRLAEQSGKELADYYYRSGKMPLAAEAYDIFLDNYPDSQWAEHATQRQIEANLATFKGSKFDSTGLLEAKHRLADYQRDYPASSQKQNADVTLKRINLELSEKVLSEAMWYEGQKKIVSARYMYTQVVEKYPDTDAGQIAAERLYALSSK